MAELPSSSDTSTPPQDGEPPNVDPDGVTSGHDSSPKERPGKAFDLLGKKVLIRSFVQDHHRPDPANTGSDWFVDTDLRIYSASWDAHSSLQKEADHSESTFEWMQLRAKNNDLKSERDKTTEILDHIMARVGNELAKKRALFIYQNDPVNQPLMHTAFAGNPGTGQTMLARLYALLLSELMRPSEPIPIEFSGYRLKSKENLKEALEEIEETKENRAIYIVTRAHHLNKYSSALQQLLKAAADSQSTLVISGDYPDFNEVLPVNNHSLHVVRFKDYDDNELHRILEHSLSGKKVEGGVNGDHLQIVSHLLSKRKEQPDFRNMHTVLDVVEKLLRRRSIRETRQKRQDQRSTGEMPRLDLLAKSDMVGEEPDDMLIQSAAWKALHDMVGLDDVKSALKETLAQNRTNFYRELLNLPSEPVLVNRCFLGPPGTGKTTAAKLYAEILLDLGLIEPKIVFKLASDLIGSCVGQSEERTTEAFGEAQGSVLIIDEFHMLYEKGGHDTYREDIIDTLVGLIQATPSTPMSESRPRKEKTTFVVIIGATHPMNELFETGNPGLARRFPLENSFQLKDYEPDQLMQIFDLKLSGLGLAVTTKARQTAEEALKLARLRPNFGNAGYVDSLIQRAKSRYKFQVATTHTSSTFSPMETLVNFLSTVDKTATITLEAEHIDPDSERPLHAVARCIELFEGLIGMERIMESLIGYQKMASRLRQRGYDPRHHVPFTFVFSGPPGTGKTTVARHLGQIFYDMGLLDGPNLIECSATDLLSQYVGRTGKKVVRLFERALGKVLFIDEAYRLSEKQAEDAVGEIVDCLTKERFRQKVVVVLAGYAENMKTLLEVNHGMRSRFPTHLHFRPMSAAQGVRLLRRLVKKVGIDIVGLNDSHKVHEILEQLIATKSWGNAREIETISRTVIESTYAGEELNSCGDVDKVLVRADTLLRILLDRLDEVSGGDAPDIQSSQFHPQSTHGNAFNDIPSALTYHEDRSNNNSPESAYESRNGGGSDDIDHDLDEIRSKLISMLHPGKQLRDIKDHPGIFSQISSTDGPIGLITEVLNLALQALNESNEERLRLIDDSLEAANRVEEASLPGPELRAITMVSKATIKTIKAQSSYHIAQTKPDKALSEQYIAELKTLVVEAIYAIEMAKTSEICTPAWGFYEVLELALKRVRELESVVKDESHFQNETFCRFRDKLSDLPQTDGSGRIEQLAEKVRLHCHRFFDHDKRDPRDLNDAINHCEEWLQLVRDGEGNNGATDTGSVLDILVLYRLYYARCMTGYRENDICRALALFREADSGVLTKRDRFWANYQDIAIYLKLLLAGLQTDFDMEDGPGISKALIPQAREAVDRTMALFRTATVTHLDPDPNLASCAKNLCLILLTISKYMYEVLRDTPDKFVKDVLEFDGLFNGSPHLHEELQFEIRSVHVDLTINKFFLSNKLEDATMLHCLACESLARFPGRTQVVYNYGYTVLITTSFLNDVSEIDKAILLLEDRLREKPEIEYEFKLNDTIARLVEEKFRILDVKDTTQLIDVLQNIVGRSPSDRNMRFQLARAYVKRFEANKNENVGDLYQALCCCKKGIELIPPQSKQEIDAVSSMFLLGRIYRLKFGITNSSDDQENAISCFQMAFHNGEQQETTRIISGIHLAKLLGGRRSWDEATKIVTDCINLLLEIAPRIAGLEDREALLVYYGELSTLGAAAIMNAADMKEEGVPRAEFIEAAVELLEKGRSIISGLELEEAGLNVLRYRCPDLARKFEDAKQQVHRLSPKLEKTPRTIIPRPLFFSLPEHDFPKNYNERKKKAQEQYEEVCEEIRRVPGFGSFLKPPTLSEIQEAADGGTIVIINHHELRTDAFLISRQDVQAIRLGQLQGWFGRQFERLLRHNIRHVPLLLCSLWRRIAEPILRTLGITGPPARGKEWPRVWWILTDKLAGLPLHAAGVHFPDTRDTVMDRVMSSYSSSVKLLIHSRNRTRTASSDQVVAQRTSTTASSISSNSTSAPATLEKAPATRKVLLTAMRTTPAEEGGRKLADLPEAEKEISEIQQILESGRGFTTKRLSPRTRENCLQEIGRCDIFHFAGHGKTNIKAPSKSLLLLDDWQDAPLTIGDLAQVRALARGQAEQKAMIPRSDSPGGGQQTGGGENIDGDVDVTTKQPFLAYLSACETLTARNDDLVNEGIHLVMGMQLAGFRHVIGTFWPVWDVSCSTMATLFYRELSSRPYGPTSTSSSHDKGSGDGNGEEDGNVVVSSTITDYDVCRALHRAIHVTRLQDYNNFLERQLRAASGHISERDAASDSDSDSNPVVGMLKVMFEILGDLFGEDISQNVSTGPEAPNTTSETHQTRSAVLADLADERKKLEDNARSLQDEARANLTVELSSSDGQEEDALDELPGVDSAELPSDPLYWASYAHYGP